MRGIKLTHQGTGCFFPNYKEVAEEEVRWMGGRDANGGRESGALQDVSQGTHPI